MSVKLLSKYLQWDSSKCQFSFFPILSQWQQNVDIATRVLIWLGQKTILFVTPAYRCCMWNMARISFMASEEMFENVDDADDGQRRMPSYTISSPMRLRLRWAKTSSPKGNDRSPESNVPRSNLISKTYKWAMETSGPNQTHPSFYACPGYQQLWWRFDQKWMG